MCILKKKVMAHQMVRFKHKWTTQTVVNTKMESFLSSSFFKAYKVRGPYFMIFIAPYFFDIFLNCSFPRKVILKCLTPWINMELFVCKEGVQKKSITMQKQVSLICIYILGIYLDKFTLLFKHSLFLFVETV